MHYTASQIASLDKLTKQLLAYQALMDVPESETQNLANQLRQVINYHDWRYYVLADSNIPDTNYDYLFDALKALESQYPETKTPDSPTQRVAHGVVDEFTTVAHLTPMLSLDKAYTEQNITDWVATVQKLIEGAVPSFMIEPKLDGSSIALVYENDLLIRGATRGDGERGDDITHNLKTLPTIPLRANFSKYGIAKAEVRGEVLISKHSFEQINLQRKERGESELANPRNSAAGALRQKDSSKMAERQLEAFIYQISAAYDADGNNLLAKQIVSHSQCIEILSQIGFRITKSVNGVANNKIYTQIDDAITDCIAFKNARNLYPYEIDGVVVKLNDLRQQDQCGSTSHHPRWAIAYKFDSRQAATTLESVDFQVGRTGAVTPVARLKTVNLAGANITNVSLHNQDFITEKDIRIGDTVLVERSGDVIPYIVKVLTENRTGQEQAIVFPDICPSCGTHLVRPQDEAIWRCINSECPAQVEEKIIHFVSKDAMDIRGLGREIIIRMMREGFISQIPDIYRLPYEKIAILEGFGEKSVANLQANIEASKNQSLSRLIIGLGIREVGATKAITLANAAKSIAQIAKFTTEQLLGLTDFGPRIVENVHNFFANAHNLHLIAELESLGVNTLQRAEDAPQQSSDKLTGLNFLFTGSLPTLTRSQAEALVTENGGSVLGSVSKKLNYLVVGSDAGSKLEKAQKISTIKIISEAEFMHLLQN
ncbi:MAG: NAD-dependent DNA ligase LigA [Sphingobacteriales bacterium]|jgi:DNA ligase (NAD+)|nr:NAD-dependent DNA ligase LigA [Sphingobacteriales bacterium]MBP9140399.1 NAD-dependent DNA ligase LigA [Chitinophagales bacterium]MDA0197335.1 NAD-dependent DNA ligase LigA [Bacteroidota bacterium]MBK6890087.1 NAD-dependent DNA ligase LigA [Sphingobacteriales bacterium]MBK7527387.1 NAD-dependent DNA ligase LigA [Sphingobacteriales bacterium]